MQIRGPELKDLRLSTDDTVSMHRWTAAEAEEYLKHIEDTAQARSSQAWNFDLQWLTNNNISIPSQLQSLCLK